MFISEEMINDYREDLRKLVSSLDAKYGVKTVVGNATYNKFDFKLQFEVRSVGTEKEKFEEYCGLYGIEKELYNHEFTFEGRKVIFYGFDLKSRKRPCIARCADGSGEYRFTVSFLLREIELDTWRKQSKK